MSYVSLTPYIQTESDGTDPRIAIPVSTPAAFVLVETRTRGLYTVKNADRTGVPVALRVAKEYCRAHRALISLLYEKIYKKK